MKSLEEVLPNAELQDDLPGDHTWGQGQKAGKPGLGSKKRN